MQGIGYGPAFLILGSFALGSVLLWVLFRADLKDACAGASRVGTAPAAA